MVVIQNIINDINIDEDKLGLVCQKFMSEAGIKESELLIRIVSPVEIQVLNKEYRAKNQVTNVLSFQSDIPEEIGEPILGDVVICADVVREEALVGDKAFSDHLTHMAIHGILHLVGHDHTDLESANKMESIEIDFLKTLGISNPYH
ncbi:rRNA maturation RNase YbeY [Candidatus Thioglobus sp.]|nr:rRNA maturation RNase YbeY [Candidatus Thioglobus sp.]